MARIPSFATVDPFNGMTADQPGLLRNLAAGEWLDTDSYREDIVDPMTGERFLDVPDTRDFAPFIAGLRSCPKSGR